MHPHLHPEEYIIPVSVTPSHRPSLSQSWWSETAAVSNVWSTVISGECSLTVTLPLLVFSAGGDWWEHCYHRRGPPGSHTHHRHRQERGANNTRIMTVLFYDHIGIMTRDDVVDSRLQSPMLAETRCCVLKCVGMRSPDWLVTILLHRYQPDQPRLSYHHYPAPPLLWILWLGRWSVRSDICWWWWCVQLDTTTVSTEEQ